FVNTITLAAHQKAADYTLAKSRFGLLGMAFGAAVLVGWTLLGGLDMLNTTARELVQPRFGSMAYQLALLGAFVLISGLLDLPFNKFEPLSDESLKSRVQALMARCGFAAKGLFVMDGSKRSAHANAYFTGFGAAKRVVFFDTLLSKLTPGEVEAVLAHELGHFKLKHVTKLLVVSFASSLAGFALLGWLSGQSAFYTAFGVQPSMSAPNDALALLLFMLVVPVFAFFVSPLLAQLSRRHEFEADAYACA